MSSSQPKPELAGVKVRKRKKDTKAKYEPDIFRDEVVTALQSSYEQGSEAVVKQIDAAGDKLDYKRYGELLFDIFFTGGVLDAGGAYTDEDADLSPFSVFAADETAEAIRKVTETLVLLMRRYRYLQKSLEDCMRKLLRVLNRFETAQSNKLAIAFAQLFVLNIVPINVLDVLFMDHLVKEGLSLQFITNLFRAYIAEQNLEHLSLNLKKNGLEDKLLDFFPPNKRTTEFFARHFSAEGLDDLVKYHTKKAVNKSKEELRDGVVEMIKTDAAVASVVAHLNQAVAGNEVPVHEIITLVWDAMMKAVEWSRKPELCEEQAVKQVKEWGKILQTCNKGAKAELALLLHLQTFCYEDTRFTKIFVKIVTLLYKLEVLSENAILYWNTKGASPKGKAMFQKQLEPLIKFLSEADEEDGSDGEE